MPRFKQLVEATPPSEFLSKEEYEELSSATQSEATGGESEQTQEEVSGWYSQGPVQFPGCWGCSCVL